MAEGNAQLGMVVRGFLKHMAKDPPTDDEIRATLEWLQQMVNGVLHGTQVQSLDEVVEALA